MVMTRVIGLFFAFTFVASLLPTPAMGANKMKILSGPEVGKMLCHRISDGRFSQADKDAAIKKCLELTKNGRFEAPIVGLCVNAKRHLVNGCIEAVKDNHFQLKVVYVCGRIIDRFLLPCLQAIKNNTYHVKMAAICETLGSFPTINCLNAIVDKNFDFDVARLCSRLDTHDILRCFTAVANRTFTAKKIEKCRFTRFKSLEHLKSCFDIL